MPTGTIKKLVSDLAFPIEIVVGPTIRESDGLALSSRNVYLSSPERIASRVLSTSLLVARRAFEAGQNDAESLRQIVRAMVGAEPLARLDYVSVADAVTLDELTRVDRPAVVSLAAWIGRTRLIDNESLRREK